MEIEVCYFAALREQVGADRETVTVEDGTTALALLAQLGERHPAAAGLLQHSRIAQSHAFVPGSVALEPDAAVDVIPPVSGG